MGRDALRYLYGEAGRAFYFPSEWWIASVDLVQEFHFDRMLIDWSTIFVIQSCSLSNGVGCQQLLILYEITR